jgi:hypothetical protein
MSDEQSRRASFSISQWCERRGISVPMYYKLAKLGRAPLTHSVGARRLISAEADSAWVRAREAESETSAA